MSTVMHGAPLTKGRPGRPARVRKPPTPAERDPEALLDIDDVAHILGVTRQTVRRFVHECGLKAVRVGRAWRFRPEWVNHFIDEILPNLKRG